jgi:hypothetical protein
MSIKIHILKGINKYTNEQIVELIKSHGFTLEELTQNNIEEFKLSEIGVSFFKDLYDLGKITEDEIRSIPDDYSRFRSDLLDQIFPVSPISMISSSPESKDAVLEKINNGDIGAGEIKSYLSSGLITEDDLIFACGIDVDMVKRLVHYSNEPIAIPPLDELGSPESGYTDVYFLGIPGSGKTCMMASLFHYLNRKGLIVPMAGNIWGANYRNHLITKLSSGLLPESTATGVINYMPMGLKDPDDMSHVHWLNIIEMAGERFSKVAQGGLNEFEQVLGFLENSNRKIFTIIIDYAQDTSTEIYKNKRTQQNLSLTTVLMQLEQSKILKKGADAIFIALTKCDMFPHGVDPATYTKEYLNEHYLSLISICKDFEYKYGTALKAVPFSIGSSAFNSMLKEYDPKINRALDKYPAELVSLFRQYSHYANERKKGWFSR